MFWKKIQWVSINYQDAPKLIFLFSFVYFSHCLLLASLFFITVFVLHHLPTNRTPMAAPLLKILFFSVLHNLVVDFTKWMRKTFSICSKSINIIHFFINWVTNSYFNMVLSLMHQLCVFMWRIVFKKVYIFFQKISSFTCSKTWNLL